MENAVRGGLASPSSAAEVERAGKHGIELLDAVAVSIMLTDASGRILFANETMCQQLGSSRSALVGQSFWSLVGNSLKATELATTAPHDVDLYVNQVVHAEDGTTKTIAWSARHVTSTTSGEACFLWTGCDVVSGATGRPRRIQQDVQGLRLIADIGTLLSSSAALRTNLQRLARRVTTDGIDGCLIAHARGDGSLECVTIEHSDPRRREALVTFQGLSLIPDRSRLLSTVFHGRRAIAVHDWDEAALLAMTDADEEQALWRTLAPTSLLALPLVADGRLVGAMALASGEPMGLTGIRKRMLGEEIAVRVARAMSDANVLYEAQKSVRARDNVLSAVAHDLRTPLHVIAMAAKHVVGHPRMHAYADLIDRQVRRMDRLIQDLLDIASIEAGHLATELRPQSVTQLLEEAVEVVAQTVEAEGLRLTLHLPPHLPLVSADRERLHQLFSNLLDNAIKFTPRGGTLAVEAWSEADEVYVVVRDTGCGIDSTHTQAVFQRFWHRDTGGRRGTGLGLAISKGIVEAHRGRIWVESERGRGTCVFVALPTINECPIRGAG